MGLTPQLGVYKSRVCMAWNFNEISSLQEGTGAKPSVVGRLRRVVSGASERGEWGGQHSSSTLQGQDLNGPDYHSADLPSWLPPDWCFGPGLEPSFRVTGNAAPSINQCLGWLLEGAVGLVAVSGAVDEAGGKAW